MAFHQSPPLSLSLSLSLLALLESSKTNVQHLGGVQLIRRGLRRGMLLLPLLAPPNHSVPLHQITTENGSEVEENCAAKA